MTTAVLPSGTRQSVLRDLTQRREKAMDLLYAAEEAGDERRWRKATERFWLRENMIWYLEQQPEDALCVACVYGDEQWQPDILTGSRPIYACLTHWADVLEREATEMAAKARWFGRR